MWERGGGGGGGEKKKKKQKKNKKKNKNKIEKILVGKKQGGVGGFKNGHYFKKNHISTYVLRPSTIKLLTT
jgi:hypothetical protein